MAEKSILLTPVGRLSYPKLFRPERNQLNPESDPKFSCVLIFDEAAQKDHRFLELRRAANDCATAKWGAKLPSNLKSPFREGAEKASDGYGEGTVFVNMTAKRKPGVIGPDKQPADEGDVYAGCYVIANVNPFAYDEKGNRGISFGLNNIMKIRDGETLAGISAEDAFANVPVAGDTRPPSKAAQGMGVKDDDLPF